MQTTSYFRLSGLVFAALFTVSVQALPEQALVPGGIALLEIPEYNAETVVNFENKPVAVYRHEDSWIALAGIPLNAKPGRYHFTVRNGSNKPISRFIEVTDKKYSEQHLTIKNKRKVNPNKQDLERIAQERTRKKKARTLRTNTLPDIDFIWPVTGRISSIFGLRRFFNEQERSPHKGLDIAAVEGTPVRATASGTVIDAGDFFFSGNLVYLDHGQGIISLYAHLSRIDVQPGDVINKGDIIGAVGQTGRVTGAHLHFAVYANQTLVDPVFLLPVNQPKQQP